MSRRYLFGPVDGGFGEQHLQRQRQRGDCRTFAFRGPADLVLEPHDSWETLCARLPADWRPEFVVLYLPYRTIPGWLWSAPVPLVGLAADWNLQWHRYRRCLPACDLVLTDSAGVEVCRRQGIDHVRAANLFGCEQRFLDHPGPERKRDIDVLFVGNLHPAVQRQRLPWLGRLARLGERWRVVLATGVFGTAYQELLARARIVFNRSIRGEVNKRTFEAAAAGALLFQEAENREVADWLRDRQECVLYRDDNLEELLEHYLSHEEERQAIAQASRERAKQYGFDEVWDGIVAEITCRIDFQSVRSSQDRLEIYPTAPMANLVGRTWQWLDSVEPAADGDLERDIAQALAKGQYGQAELHNLLGVIAGRKLKGQGPVSKAVAEQVAGYFRRAVAADPEDVLAGLNLAEALVGLDRRAEAVEQARRTLTLLERARNGERAWEAPHFPPGFDHFRVEWERAAWEHAGKPAEEQRAKVGLLRWRLHTILADLTGELRHYYEAVLAQPELPAGRAALGCALARLKQPAAAVPHLLQAVAANPFDRDAARACFHALGEAGDAAGQRRLAQERRLLSAAAPAVVPPEPWFGQCPPLGDELASLIILCCNEVDYTRRCLESVLRHTRSPYELILVDNGSTDATSAYLDEVRSRPGPWRVVVLRNENNRGFPAGCNQGLAQARGRYVVFLNNDTVVTAGWLDGLIGWSLHDWPKVGLVGAVTNYSRPPQQIAVDYRQLEQLDAFAARRRQEFAGKAVDVERLTGFCLLARREVLNQVGGFDERYGVGFFDDDDLALRARQAGFRLLVALNVFIHHFGSRTFTGLGVDCRRQLQDNFELFRQKWGAEHCAGYQEPGVRNQESGVRGQESGVGEAGARTAVAAGPRSAARVSLCLIVKNEEANLPACLEGAADLVQEIVVVDTGSTDGTRAVAARFGARMVEFPWVDSFAVARNESLRHATGQWIFWLDADDRLDAGNRQKLRTLFAGLGDENAAYCMKCLCLPDPRTGTATVVDHVRLFRNHPEIRWKYRVHEQILPAIRQQGGELRWADVVIQHAGYLDPALRRRKLERDLRLLELAHAEEPEEPFVLFNLGQIHQELGRHAEALPLLRRSLERSQPQDSIVRKLFALIVQCHRHVGQQEEALTACRAGRGYYGDDAELLLLEGLIQRERGEAAAAEAAWLRLLHGTESEHFASVATGLRGFKTRHNLALLYLEQQRLAEAEAQWRMALAEEAGFLPAWLGLGEHLLAQQRWEDLEPVLAEVATRAPGGVEAAVLRARGHLARQEYAAARRLLEEAIGREPATLWPRVVLSHVLLQEGKDPAAAEEALRAVLALAPEHAEAKRNLELLLRHPRRPSE